MLEVAFDIINKASDETRERWITHYSSSQRILLVGEGDFSFSACLARTFAPAKNMVATSLDTEAELQNKYLSSADNVDQLKALGCVVLHGIDVCDMHEHHILKKMKFDRIIFNFPHAGHDPWYRETDGVLIQRHKDLLEAFFMSASKMLSEDGEVHVSHRNDHPYNTWNLELLAEEVGFMLTQMVDFRKSDYPGYHNKRGGWIRSNGTFPLKDGFTFKFVLGSVIEEGSVSDELSRNLSCLHV